MFQRVFKALLLVVFACSLQGATEELLVVRGLTGHPGGKLVFAQRTEPKTLNPLMADDQPSREVIHRMTADLIHINRESQQTEPALAKSWKVSADGRRYTLELRQGLRFSDGHPFDADDVIFTFQVVLDEKLHSPQRDLWILDGQPITVRKLDAYKVVFELPKPDAVAERLFDGVAILPRHRLEKIWREGKLGDAWNPQTPPGEMAGLGPFRLKDYSAGQYLTLERNSYYWKADEAGNRLPYLQQATFLFAGTEDNQVLRFQAGETDVISRINSRSYGVLEKDQERWGYVLHNLGPGFEFNFLFFNLNDLGPKASPQAMAHQALFRRLAFRRAVSAAIDRDAMVRLIYLRHAASLAGPVPPGNNPWINSKIPPPVRSLARARELLAADGFKWNRDGAVLDPEGRPVEFSIVASNSNAERLQMATLIQDDLKQLGMKVNVAPLEFRSMLARLQSTYDYDACVLGMQSPDADPNPDMAIWLSSGGSHFWRPSQKTPATPWEAEIDDLMRQQMVTRKYSERKQMFDRVQELLAEYLPVIPLVSPDILVGAKKSLGNFRPALLDHYVLWNIEELYWKPASGGAQR